MLRGDRGVRCECSERGWGGWERGDEWRLASDSRILSAKFRSSWAVGSHHLSCTCFIPSHPSDYSSTFLCEPIVSACRCLQKPPPKSIWDGAKERAGSPSDRQEIPPPGLRRHALTPSSPQPAQSIPRPLVRDRAAIRWTPRRAMRLRDRRARADAPPLTLGHCADGGECRRVAAGNT